VLTELALSIHSSRSFGLHDIVSRVCSRTVQWAIDLTKRGLSMKMQRLSKAELEQQSQMALRSFFVSSLKSLPEGFTWDYERVGSDTRGCALSLAKYLGVVEPTTTYTLAETLGLPQKKVHAICYHLHNKHSCHPREVTADMVATAFEKLIVKA
jgi:hypothetical protein